MSGILVVILISLRRARAGTLSQRGLVEATVCVAAVGALHLGFSG